MGTWVVPVLHAAGEGRAVAILLLLQRVGVLVTADMLWTLWYCGLASAAAYVLGEVGYMRGRRGL